MLRALVLGALAGAAFGQSTAVVDPSQNVIKWEAPVGGTVSRGCDACWCSGKQTKFCNPSTGKFEEVNDSDRCEGARVWSDWSAWGPWSQCINGFLTRQQERSCCGGDGGWCYEWWPETAQSPWGPFGGYKAQWDENAKIQVHDVCKAKCLCNNPDPSCRRTTADPAYRNEASGIAYAPRIRVDKRPAGPFTCEPTSLLPFCDPTGPNGPEECKRKGYAGQPSCSDLWPRVNINGGDAPVTSEARCGCGYKGRQTRRCVLNADGCGAQWEPADRSRCVKIDWLPGCEDWSQCSPNNGLCGSGTQRCRRKCNTGDFNDCLHAAHVGCIDEQTHIEKPCCIKPPLWDNWGPYGRVVDNTKFIAGNFPGEGAVEPSCANNPRDDSCPFECTNLCPSGDRCETCKQIRFYQCETKKREDCKQACSCYSDPCVISSFLGAEEAARQQDICVNNIGYREKSPCQQCQCVEYEKQCPDGVDCRAYDIYG